MALARLSDDSVYINQPLEPVVGQQDVRKIVAGIMQLSHRVHWELRNCFGHGNTVVTERLDCWDFDGKGWDDLDVDACMAQVTDDMCYLNQPLGAIRGKANVRKMFASIFAPAKHAEFKPLNVFGSGDRGITERLDQWDWDGSGTWQLQFPVCGMFELTEDGKIYEWREYYDNQHWSRNGGPSLVLSRLTI